MSSNDPIQETESVDEISTQQESQKPLILVEDSQESKKSRAHDDSGEGWSEEEGSAAATEAEDGGGGGGGSGRERLKRHRVEVAGRVWIPDMWGQEDLLKDWADCVSFDASLIRNTILIARDSLAKEGRRSNSTGICRLHHSC